MRVEYHQGREVCERCGAYIKHVYVVTFDDGFIVRCGSECVKRVLKDTNLTDRGAKFLQAQMKRVKMITERAELMYADARRLTVRYRLVIEPRWASANPDIPDEVRAEATRLADLAADGASPEALVAVTKAATDVISPGRPGRGWLLATVHEVATLSRGNLDRG